MGEGGEMNTELLRADERGNPDPYLMCTLLRQRLIEEREKNAFLSDRLGEERDRSISWRLQAERESEIRARAEAELAEARKEIDRLMPFVDSFNEELNKNADWRELWEAVREALNEDDRPYKGWHRIRAFLESRGQYVENLGDNALLCAAIDAAMKVKK